MPRKKQSPGQLDLFNPIPHMKSVPTRKRQPQATPDRLKGIQQPLDIYQAEAIAIGFDGGDLPLKEGDRVRALLVKGVSIASRITRLGYWSVQVPDRTASQILSL